MYTHLFFCLFVWQTKMFKLSTLVATSFTLSLMSIASGGEYDSSSDGGTSRLPAVEHGDVKPPVFPNACVKMALYNNTKCEGHAEKVLMYPTWDKPQKSPCCTYSVCVW